MESPVPAWSYRPPAHAARRRAGDAYIVWLGVVLTGYALAGRGFAYLGVPPVFVGEVTLALGLAVLAASLRRTSLGPAGPAFLTGGLVLWAGVRVAMGAPEWGLDAVRDGMLVFYALFSLVAAGLVLERPDRLRWLVRHFGWVVWGVALVAWPLHFVGRFLDVFPELPWAERVTVIQTKPGDLLVLLAAGVAYLVGGFQRARPALLVGVVAGTMGLMVTSRGGMLGFVLAAALALAWRPASARVGRLVYVGAVLIALGLAVGSAGLSVNGGSREISMDQIWENVMSVTGQSDDVSLQGTAEWRLQWWEDILGYTFGGERFLDGKGFGINLSVSDGYVVDEEQALRSPHNSHLTVLARGGVPMFLVWMLLQGVWFARVAAAVRRARRAGLDGWVAFYAVCAAFWLGAHVNASFDVYLEGPMGAVWFWTVFGLALAGTRLQTSHPRLLDDLRPGAPSASRAAPAHGDGAAAQPPSWSWSPAPAGQADR